MPDPISRCAWCGNPVFRSEGHVVEHGGRCAVWHPMCVELDVQCFRWPMPTAIVLEMVERRGGGRVVSA